MSGNTSNNARVLYGPEITAYEAGKQETAIAVRKLHRIEGGGAYCTEDGFRWPCATERAVRAVLEGDG